ncbi:hypothetical protein F5I97DRAFT_1844816 [Phlebopus sp. FC_14]|nr:hypothetical protein F5I97DRAFT_1844816 [Phlebopus sp. FC_14]
MEHTCITFGKDTFHPVYDQVVQIVTLFYRNYHPVPVRIDRWTNPPELKFYSDESQVEPSSAILYLQEPLNPGRITRLCVDLIALQVRDMVWDISFPASPDVCAAARDIVEHVRSALLRKKEEINRRVGEDVLQFLRDKQERELHCKDFYQRLFDCNLIDGDDLQYWIDDTTCPVCFSLQITCTSCRLVSCENRACKGAEIIPVYRCTEHADQTYCLDCLARGDIKPKLGQCPRCKLWFCSEEIYWCHGRPLPESPPTTHLREHGLQPIECQRCRLSDNSPMRCDNITCWSTLIPGCDRICPRCCPSRGRRCVCGNFWVCDACKEDATMNAFMLCPHCHRMFCQYACRGEIRRCMDCKKSRLCHDCLEEILLDAFDQRSCLEARDIQPSNRCFNCAGDICAPCSSVQKIFCGDCGQRLCRRCASRQTCQNCGVSKCVLCHHWEKRQPLCEDCEDIVYEEAYWEELA